jgi:hypothetical protein
MGADDAWWGRRGGRVASRPCFAARCGMAATPVHAWGALLCCCPATASPDPGILLLPHATPRGGVGDPLCSDPPLPGRDRARIASESDTNPLTGRVFAVYCEHQ